MSGPEREPTESLGLVELFERLLDLPDEAARARFLGSLEQRAPQLAERLRRLLSAHGSAEGERFLEKCAAEILGALTRGGLRNIILGPAMGAAHGEAPTLIAGHRPGPGPAPSCVPDKIAHYRLLQRVGQGGMGSVYRALDQKLGRVVALKVCRLAGPGWSARARTLYDEARLAAQLDHPNIIAVYDAGFDGEWQYVAMQFVEGETLGHVLRRGALPPRVAAVLVRAVAQTVHYAHQQGVVHRDIKPGNILLAQDDGSGGKRGDGRGSLGAPRIGDFGLARPLNTDDTITQTTVVCGTPSYMAPEQATSSSYSIDPRTDIYSLGAVLYACLTGAPPFEGETLLQTVCKLLEEEPVPPRRRNKEVPADLDLVVLKCLRKEPARRYQTAGELAEDLDRFLNDRPVLARRGASLYRWSRWCKRERRFLGALLAFVLVLGVLGLVTALAVCSVRRAHQQVAAVRTELEQRRRQSLVAQALAAARSAQPGRRGRALEHLKQAARLGAGPDIRDAAGFSLELFDVQVEKEWGLSENEERLVISPDLAWFVTFGAEGNWCFGQMDTHEILRRFDGLPHGWTRAALSRGGRYLAVYEGGTGALSVLSCADGSTVLSVSTFPRSGAFSFHPVHEQLFVQLRNGALSCYELDHAGSKVLTRAPPCRRLVFNPTGDFLALVLSDRAAADVLDLEGIRRRRVPLGELASTAALDRSGRLFAVGHPSGKIAIWQLGDQPRLLRSWRGHTRQIHALTFLVGGNVVASRSRDGTTAYWDFLAGRELLRTSYRIQGGSGSGSDKHAFWTNAAFGLLRVVRPIAWREIQGDDGELCLNWCSVAFVDNQGLLLCAGERGIYVWDVWNGVGLGWIERRPVQGVAYLAKTLECVYAAGGRVWSRKLRFRRTDRRRRALVTKAVLLYDGEGRHVRFGAAEGGGSLLITDAGSVLCLKRGPGFVSVHPVGHHANANGGVVGPYAGWFLTQTCAGKGVLLWHAHAAEPVNLWPGARSSRVGLFPGGDVAWASTGRRFRFWRTDSWAQIAVLNRERFTEHPGVLAVSESSGLMAVAMTPTEMRLMTRPATCETILSLRSPFPGELRQIAFDRTGRFVAAATDRSVQLWDLRALAREFERLGTTCRLPSFRALPAPVTPCELSLEE